MLRQCIFHVDVNSAYLSWEAAHRKQAGRPIDLRDIPSIVGGDRSKRHGIVLAKSIPAKKLGIKTGESIFMALQKCPDLTIVPPDFKRYMKASRAMVDLLREYSPYIQEYSIDEAFLSYPFDPNKDHIRVAQEIAKRIKEELGFTVNIGVGDNKLLAKMASDFTKPDRVHTLFLDEIGAKLWPLPVGDLFMVGSKTKAKLNNRGIFTIGELANSNPDYIHSWLKKPGLTLWEYANGLGDSTIRTEADPVKSISNSTTSAFDVDKKEEAHLFLLAISELLGVRIRAKGMCASVISLHIKEDDFYSYRRQKKIAIPTNSTNKIYEVAKELLGSIWSGKPLRKFSISLSGIVSDDFVQLSILEEDSERDMRLDRTIDKIRGKYGLDSIKRSAFVNSGIDHMIGGVEELQEDYKLVNKF